jgi:succinate dehydrogenase/fumarate reductase flavoprotein subunit
MSKDQCDTGRRDFLKTTGIGVAAMTMAGAGLLANANPVSAAATLSDQFDTDVLVIGGGVAGIFAALNAKAKGARVILVDKGRVGKSGLSPFWGGTTYYDPDWNAKYGLTQDKMLGELVKVEEYLSNQTYWRMWMEHSKEVLDLGRSIGMIGAKNNQRGPNLRKALVDKDIQLIERTMVTSLIQKGDRVAGVIGFSLDDEKAIAVNAKAVIICAGAGTFKTPGWPGHSTTHDGQALAYRAGAAITGKEFVDYHVTLRDDPGGFGACGGHAPSMADGVVVYPGIDNRGVLSDDMRAHRGDYPSADAMGGHPEISEGLMEPLDIPGGPADPGIKMEGGGPPPGGPGGPPVMVGGSSSGAAPHKCDGIVPQDNECGTGVVGLFAAGDALCTSGAVYGATCGSSSCSYTVGYLAGGFAADYAKSIKATPADKGYVAMLKEEMMAPRERKQGFSPRWVTQILQGAMVPYYVLNVKKEDRLLAALATVEFLRDQFGGNMLANDIHELRLVHETQNMLLNAEMKLRAGLERKESRGSHFREEYPARDDKNWLAWIIIEQSKDGSMKLSKRNIPEEWKPSPKLSYVEKYPSTRYIGEEEYLKKKGIKI